MPIGGSSAVPFILAVFIALFLAFIVYQFFFSRIPQLPRTGRDWGSTGSNDPRVAMAAMMFAVATEDGPLSLEKERRILSQLTSKVGLAPDLARTCLAGGKRLAAGLYGDLNSRLHQLVAPIEAQCSPEEKRDVIDMLRQIAGPSAHRVGSVRDGLGRLSSSLLRG
jgi:uncharacterized tellurite resistance protein B-like protein